MRRIVLIVKRLVIALGLAALLIVLFPSHAEPLWNWGKSIGEAFGQDVLPGFGSAQEIAALSLLALVLGGIVYTLWRDRRLEVLQAEYAHRTGAKNLKDKVRDLQNRVQTLTAERDACRETIAGLTEQHTAALVTAKEHEVRSQFGSEDRHELRELRKKFEEILREKGHTEGFRVAMDHMMRDMSHGADVPNVSVEAVEPAEDSAANGQTWDRRQQAALPFRN